MDIEFDSAKLPRPDANVRLSKAVAPSTVLSRDSSLRILNKTKSRPLEPPRNAVMETARFHNPFPGRHVPLKISGLMQLCPTVLHRLMGAAHSTIHAESGTAALFKAANRALKTKNYSLKLLRRLSDVIPTEHEHSAVFRAALAGDVDAQRIVDGMGSWESLYPQVDGKTRYRTMARVAIERAATRPHILASELRYGEAVDYMLRDPLLSLFLWDEAAKVFRRATEFEKLRIAQSSLVLETELSALAALDVELCSEGVEDTDSMFRSLLPSSATAKANPARLLFLWFKAEFGLKSIDSILSHPRLLELELAEATVKRWSSGSHCISEEMFGQMVSALTGNEAHVPALSRHWAAQVLNLIGYLGQHCSTHARALAATDFPRAAAPWPEYPFGYPSFEEWCKARYPFWLEYHGREIQRFEASKGATPSKN